MLTYSFHFSQFNNLSFFSRKNPSLTQFIPEIYNKIIIKIIAYFWGVTNNLCLIPQIKCLFYQKRIGECPCSRYICHCHLLVHLLIIGSHELLPSITFFLEQLLVFCHLSYKFIKICKFHTLKFFPQINVQTSLGHFMYSVSERWILHLFVIFLNREMNKSTVSSFL